MKKISYILLILISLIVVLLTSNSRVKAVSVVPNGSIGQVYNWSLIFEDNFDTSPVNNTKWAPCIYWGITSNGCYENLSNAEWYMPANSTVNNGILTLQARKQKTVYKKQTFNYTSGLLTSDRDTNTTSVPAKFDFTYGYAEIRAKVPAGKGLWPAFWMLPSDHSDTSEIDVMEILGDHPEKNYMTYHYGSGQQLSSSFVITGTDFSKDYHTYAVDWNPDSMVWYIDGVEKYRITDAAVLPNKAFYLIANLQVGTRNTWPGAPDNSTVFPANYDIDYVRVWKKGNPLPTTIPSPTPTGVMTNILINPSFESGVTPWFLDVKTGALASVANDSTVFTDGVYSAQANTTQVSGTDWHVQLAQSNLPLVKNSLYKIQFMAKSDSATARSIPVIIQQNYGNYVEYFNQNISLTNQWTLYSLDFTPTVDDNNVKLSFSLGGQTGKVWFDQLFFGK